jgi:spore coat protein CotH
MSHFYRAAAVAALFLIVPACGGSHGSDPSASLFEPGRIVEVSISMSPADWDALRLQGRSLTDIFGEGCLTGPFPSPFTWFRGSVTIDGRPYADVAVRKKGFLGSLDESKPSLKLKFDEFVPGREVFGLDRMTLNNSKQDPAYVRQALAYAAFARAGVPAPRCNFAHVTVNGTDLGLFVHVESVDKNFLRRHFLSPNGNLYEGTLSDFRPLWTNTFDKKTNEAVTDRGDLEAVVAALDAPDPDCVTELGRVLDVEQFLTFWAAEVLVNHWDGYSNNQNNYFVYGDPVAGRLRLLPWGTDGVMEKAVRFGVEGQPVSVFAQGAISRRLYLLPETQARYRDRLRTLLDTVWDETAILAEIDRMEQLITPLADPGGTKGLAAEIEEVRDFVRTRRAALLAELDAAPPAWTWPLPQPPCFEVLGDWSGTFSTTFGTLNSPTPFSAGTGTLIGSIRGVPRTFTAVGSTCGNNPDPLAEAIQTHVLGLRGDGTIDVVLLDVKKPLFVAGGAVPLDWGSGFGAVLNFDPKTATATMVGLIFEGVVGFTKAGTTPGSPVTGSFQGKVVKFRD